MDDFFFEFAVCDGDYQKEHTFIGQSLVANRQKCSNSQTDGQPFIYFHTHSFPNTHVERVQRCSTFSSVSSAKFNFHPYLEHGYSKIRKNLCEYEQPPHLQGLLCTVDASVYLTTTFAVKVSISSDSTMIR